MTYTDLTELINGIAPHYEPWIPLDRWVGPQVQFAGIWDAGQELPSSMVVVPNCDRMPRKTKKALKKLMVGCRLSSMENRRVSRMRFVPWME